MKIAILVASGIALISALAVQIYYREKFQRELEWNKETFSTSYWKIVLEFRKQHPAEGSKVVTALIVQIISACTFFLTLYSL